MAVAEARFYSWDDPNGTPVGTLTEEHAQIEIRHSFRGMGSGRIRISRSRPEATVALFGMGHTGISGPRLVKVHYPWLPAPFDTDPVFAFWLWDGDFELLNHKGDDQLTFFGPGVRGILYDYIPGNASTVFTQPSRGSGDHPDLWWWIDQPYGAIATRLWEEGRHNPGGSAPAAGSTFEHVTIDFDRVLDSDGQPWAQIAAEYEFRIGNSVGDVWGDLEKAGDYIVVGRPDLSFSAYSSYGDDLTGAAYGAGVVRVTPDNILTELDRHADLQQQRTHLLVRLNEGSYFTRTHPDYVAGFPERWAFRENPNTNDQPFRIKQIDASFDEYDRQQNALKLELKVGNTPGSGLYLPWVHYKPGDTITVDNGTEEYDYQDEDALITAISVVLDEKAADDSTDERAYRSIHVVLELNSESREEGGREQPSGRSGCTCPPLCKASIGINLPGLSTSNSDGTDNPGVPLGITVGAEPDALLLYFLGTAGVVPTTAKWTEGEHGIDTTFQAMDLLDSDASGTDHDIYVFGLRDPNPSTHATSAITDDAPDSRFGKAALLYQDVQGTTPADAVRASNTATGTSTAPSVSISGLEAGDICIAALSYHDHSASEASVGITEDPAWTELEYATSGGTHSAGIHVIQRTADGDSVTASWTLTRSEQWMASIIVLKAASYAGEVPNPLADDGEASMNPDGCSCVAPGCHTHEHGTPAGGPHHSAAQVTIADAAGDFTATDVEGALAELQSDAEADATDLANHLADASDAHDASAVSILDTAGDFTATDVEGALAELQADAETHAATPHGGGIGPLLLSSDHAVPIVFDDILQASDGSDFLYASEP